MFEELPRPNFKNKSVAVNIIVVEGIFCGRVKSCPAWRAIGATRVTFELTFRSELTQDQGNELVCLDLIYG